MIPDTRAHATRSPTVHDDVESRCPPAPSGPNPPSDTSPSDAPPIIGFPVAAAAAGPGTCAPAGNLHLLFASPVASATRGSNLRRPPTPSHPNPPSDTSPSDTPPTIGGAVRVAPPADQDRHPANAAAAASPGTCATTSSLHLPFASPVASATRGSNLPFASSASHPFFGTISPAIASGTATGSPLAAPPIGLSSGTTAYSPGTVSNAPAVLTSPAAAVPAVTPTVNLPFSRTKTTTTSTAPNVSRPGRIDDDIQEILEHSDPEEFIDARTELEMRKNSYKCLIAMTIGLKDDSGSDLVDLEKEPFKSYHLRRNLRPDKTAYWNEVMRRHNIKKLVPRDKIGKYLPNEQYIELLQQNPVVQPSCVEFLRKKIKQMKSDIDEFNKEKELNSSRAKRTYFTGLLFKLRLIESLLGCENARTALTVQFNSLNRRELDGRSNPDAARLCAFTIATENYNDEEFVAKTVELGYLHEELKDPVKVTYSDISHMGKMTKERMENEYTKMVAELKVFRSKWNRSGNGEGTREDEVSDAVTDADGDDCGLGGAMQMKQNFLGTYGPHILYLEARSTQLGIIHVVAQSMKRGMEMDGSAPSVYPPEKRPKNGDTVNAMYSSLNKEISKTNKALAVSNLDAKKERRSMLKREYRELLLKIMEMRKKGVSEELLEVYEEANQQVADEVKELDTEIAKYKAEITKDDNAQEKSNN